jgi:putative spermidine/putrescine transport system substrate-binding protein
MHEVSDFARDCVELLQERLAAGAISRRSFLRGCAALGAAPALLGGRGAAAAESKELVLCNFGGDAITAFNKAWVEPFMAKNPGIKVVIDGTGPTSGKIKAMVESGKVSWDVVDRNLAAAAELGPQNLLEEIDYEIVDKNKVRPDHSSKWAVGSYIFAYPLVYDTKAWGGRVPTGWKDFFDLKSFPGKRMLRKHIDGQLEAALIGDGVDPKKLYPLDVKRALDKIRSIKEHVIFWGNGAESQQAFRDGEVVMGNMWNTRSTVIRQESKGRFDFTFNQASVWVGAWLIPNGAKGGKATMQYIASTQDPAEQVELFKMIGNGPVNPAAAKLVPAELKNLDPGAPENYSREVLADADWYARNSEKVLNQYLEMVSS